MLPSGTLPFVCQRTGHFRTWRPWRNFSLRRSWRVCYHSCRYILPGSSSNFGIPRRSNGNIHIHVPALSCTLLEGESCGSSEAVGLTGSLPPAGIRVTTATPEEFQQVLLSKGVRSRPLREKLIGIFSISTR